MKGEAHKGGKMKNATTSIPRKVRINRTATYILRLEKALSAANASDAALLKKELAIVRPAYEKLVEGLTK